LHHPDVLLIGSGMASPHHQLAILRSAVPLGCSNGPVVQRRPMVSACALLPASSSLQGGRASALAIAGRLPKL